MTFKHLILLAPVILLIASQADAQRVEKFDIVSFTPPSGWQEKSSDEARAFLISDEKAGTFCMITLLRSVPSQGNSKTDFDLVWKTMVADQFGQTVNRRGVRAVSSKGGQARRVLHRLNRKA